MTENESSLIKDFQRINKSGWIPSVSGSWGAVGLTFEKEINKKVDATFFPDFKDIEIKCSTRYSNYPLFLFTIAFDGPTFPEINRLIEKYGWEDKNYKEKKVLFINVNCKELSEIYKGYHYIFKIDRENEKLILCIYNRNKKLIDDASFVYFDSIKTHFNLKLKKLAYINAMKKKVKKEDYYHYYRLRIYNSRNFETFIKLLEEGVVYTSVIARINKSGIDKGKYRNKNIAL